jgi:lipopolysaccharide transport system permease protein
MSYKKSNFLELVWVRATLNLRSEASLNKLSYMWWVIEPVLHMAAYYTVFSVLLNRGDEKYVAFLLSGLIPWLWFSRSISRSMHSISKGESLMNQLYIPKVFFPLTCLIQDTIKQIVVFALLIIFMLFFGSGATLNTLWVIPIILGQLVFIYGISLSIALVIPFVRDVSNIVPSFLQFIMFCSGIFFSYKDISEDIQKYFFINPMAVLLRNYREVLIDGVAPNLGLLSYVYILGMTLFLLSLYLYDKLDYKISRVILK